MSAQLQLEFNDKRMVARLSGIADIDKVPERLEEIARHCRGTNTERLIIDVTNVMLPLSVADKFQMGVHAAIFAQYGIKVAVVVTPDQLDPERFGELVARNRGVNVRVFTEVHAAETWLFAE